MPQVWNLLLRIQLIVLALILLQNIIWDISSNNFHTLTKHNNLVKCSYIKFGSAQRFFLIFGHENEGGRAGNEIRKGERTAVDVQKANGKNTRLFAVLSTSSPRKWFSRPYTPQQRSCLHCQ